MRSGSFGAQGDHGIRERARAAAKHRDGQGGEGWIPAEPFFSNRVRSWEKPCQSELGNLRSGPEAGASDELARRGRLLEAMAC